MSDNKNIYLRLSVLIISIVGIGASVFIEQLVEGWFEILAATYLCAAGTFAVRHAASDPKYLVTDGSILRRVRPIICSDEELSKVLGFFALAAIVFSVGWKDFVEKPERSCSQTCCHEAVPEKSQPDSSQKTKPK